MATSKPADDIVTQDAPLQFPAEDHLNQTSSMDEVIRNAKTATDSEHSMSLLQGIKLYPKAVAWSMLISTCICMEGYDVCLLSNFCELGKFGHLLPKKLLQTDRVIFHIQTGFLNSTRSTERNCRMERIRCLLRGKLV